MKYKLEYRPTIKCFDIEEIYLGKHSEILRENLVLYRNK